MIHIRAFLCQVSRGLSEELFFTFWLVLTYMNSEWNSEWNSEEQEKRSFNIYQYFMLTTLYLLGCLSLLQAVVYVKQLFPTAPAPSLQVR